MMKLDRKEVSDHKPAAAAATDMRILLLSGEHGESVEIHAALARLSGLVVDTVPTLARLALTLQKGGARPDLIIVDINTESSDDLATLRDLRKVSGLAD